MSEEKIIQELRDAGRVQEFYRFQGHMSFEHFNIRTNRFEVKDERYVYVSRTPTHHCYFTVKRIRQLINTSILNNTPYQISRSQLKDPKSFSRIKSLIINSEKIRQLTSISLVCERSFYTLLEDNCIYNMHKTFQSGIERVDRRVHGGGYGVTGAWLHLFNDLVFFSSSTRFNAQDVIKLLESIRNGSGQTNPKLIEEILRRKPRAYSISKNLYDDFHKYRIMEDLDRIEQERLVLPGSELSKRPEATKKKVLQLYQNTRSQILSSYDK